MSLFEVQYLVTFDGKDSICKDEKSFISLMQASSDISVADGFIEDHDCKAEFSLSMGNHRVEKNEYFHLKFCYETTEYDLDLVCFFSQLLRKVKKSLSIKEVSIHTIRDDISEFYAKDAYEIIYKLENLMRSVISKFMITNVGRNWAVEKVPSDVKDSIRDQKIKPSQPDFLYHVDLIGLSDFLFSNAYRDDQDKLIKKLKTVKQITDANLDEINRLIPQTNWDKYFKPIIKCEAESLKKKWKVLYELRCAVAHNSGFSIGDMERLRAIDISLTPVLRKALHSIDNIDVPVNGKTDLLKIAEKNQHNNVNEFTLEHSRILALLDNLWKTYIPKEVDNIGYEPTALSISKALYDRKIITYDNLSTVENLLKWMYDLRHNLQNSDVDLDHKIPILRCLASELEGY